MGQGPAVIADTASAEQLCKDLDQVPGPLGLGHWCVLATSHREHHRCRCGWRVKRGQEGAHPRS